MRGYARDVRRVLLAVLVLNAIVATAKLITGWWTGSLSVLGDGLHSSVDALHNVVALILIHYATQPPDENHPFGHAKFETLGAFVLSGILLLTAFELATEAVSRLFGGHTAPEVNPVAILVLVATLVVNLFVSTLEARSARRLGSDMLLADAKHTRSDVYVTLAVLGGLLAQRLGATWADPLIALGVALVIAYVAYQVFKEAIPVLTDEAVYDPRDVETLVTDVPGVESVHDIRSRGRPNEAFIQMHLVVETRDVVKAHDITERVERRLENELGAREVLVHVEPWDDSDEPHGPTPTDTRASSG